MIGNQTTQLKNGQKIGMDTLPKKCFPNKNMKTSISLFI